MVRSLVNKLRTASSHRFACVAQNLHQPRRDFLSIPRKHPMLFNVDLSYLRSQEPVGLKYIQKSTYSDYDPPKTVPKLLKRP